MILQIGTVVGYNNEIVIATENQKLGFNSDVNVKPVEPTTQPTTIEGTPTKKQPEPKTITPKPKTIIPEPKPITHLNLLYQNPLYRIRKQRINRNLKL